MEEIKTKLRSMSGISLSEMKDVQLQNRMDTKFVFHRKLLPDVLDYLHSTYAVFEIANQRISLYESIYFDTKDDKFYLDHHNKKNHRIKVRKRKYHSNGLTFFEIKEKRAGRTIKNRITIENFANDLDRKERNFLQEVWGEEMKLQATLINQYFRITLVNHAKTERITLDLRVAFVKDNGLVALDELVVAELKQGKINRSSLFYKLMREMNIAPFRISKYCIGRVILEDAQKIKYNRFKRKLLKLKKIANDIK